MAVEMKILNSHEGWLVARRNYVGGSDASAVLGMNPYKTNIELWEEKTGLLVPEDISDKPYVKYGHAAEPLLRGLFALDFPEYSVGYKDNNIWLNDQYPWAHASLDGWLTELATGRMDKLGVTDLFDPCQGALVAIDFLAELLERYDGSMEKALTAYNQGSFKGVVTQYAKAVIARAGELKVIEVEY